MGRIKEKSKKVARATVHRGKRTSVATARIAKRTAIRTGRLAKATLARSGRATKKTAIVTARVAKRVPQTRVYKKTKAVAKKTHHVVAKRPHEKLMVKSKKYAWWHTWRYKKLNHKHIHGFIVIVWIMLVGFFVSSNTPTIFALSTWSQSDWSGGVGTNTSNQYTSISNLDTSGGTLRVNKQDSITNGTFENNLDGWKVTGTNAGTFAPKADYTTGSKPYGATSADFNNDDSSDLAITNMNVDSISILLGYGDGSFASKVDYYVGTRPAGITHGDLDSDNDIDLVVSNNGSSNITVLMNNGDGTFAQGVNYPVTNSPYLPVIADFNNDNNQDIATTNHEGNSISILMNNGDGTFVGKVDYSTGGRPIGLTSADLDGDGDIDLAATDYTNSLVVVLKNNGDGTFAPGVTYSNLGQSYNISNADFDNDGDIDLASALYSGTTYVNVFMNNGDGTFAPRVSYSIGRAVGSDVGDIDGDGDIDILATYSSNSQIQILKNNGDGTFAPRVTYTTGSTPYFVEINDYNKDGNPDLAVTSNGTNSVSVLLNSGDPRYHSSEQAYNSSTHSTKIVATSADNSYYQIVSAPVGSNKLTAYVYKDGTAITSADAQLYAGGSPVPTTYSPTSATGWYKLTAVITGTNNPTKYGVIVKAGRTLYVDNVSLEFYGVGILTSAIKDTGTGEIWNVLTYSSSGDGSAEVRLRSSNNSDMTGAPDFAGCPSIASNSSLGGLSCLNDNDRYIQYQVKLTGDNGDTPIFDNVGITYSPYDNVPPTQNANNIIMKREAGGANVGEGDWTNHNQPYFEWQAAVDNSGGTGIKGYCLYLGSSPTADPVTTKGNLGVSPLDTGGVCPFAIGTTYINLADSNLLETALTSSNSLYYLNVKAIDNVNNVFSGASEQFSFKFDNTPPKNPDFITAPSQFVASKDVTFTWPTNGQEAPSDDHSGLKGLQYRIGSNGLWYGDAHTGNQDIADLLVNDGSYTTTDPPDYSNINEGNNVFYFRTWDNAGNVSSVYTTSVLKLNTSSPSSPRNTTGSPASNTVNSFSFSWVEPSTFQGSASNLTYCYSVNTLPTASTCTFTNPGVTSLPVGAYATQPDENTFYVVAKDEAGNINYATAASTTFTANTSAPGIPLNMDIADISIKSTTTWKLALTWNTPTDEGAGVATYRVYRSTDNVNFVQIASTSGTSYVDTGLSAVKYYYKIRACDSANNCGAYSSVVNMTPTGKFTSPANLIVQPNVSGISTKKATVQWATNRESDSKIALGTSPGKYEPYRVASDNQTTDHVIELANLSPGTTYYAKALWTDEDGNTGSSSEFSFKTQPAPSTQEVTTLHTTLSSAQIRFTSLLAAKVVIQYGKSNSFGGVKEIATSLSKSTYDIEISGLDDGSKYFYRLNTFDADGNEYTGTTILTFNTPARPKIDNLRFQPIEGEPTSTQKVTWQTNVPTSSLIRYTPKGGSSKEISSSKLVNDHEIIVKDLLDNTQYSLVAESRDAGGNLAITDVQTFHTALDTRPPKITDIYVETSIKGTGAEARGQVIVSWTTDEPSTSQVAYADGSKATELNNKTYEDSMMGLEHIVVISDLPTSRVYSVRPISKDKSGNSSEGTIKSAVVGRASESIMSIVLNTLRKVFGF